MIGHTGFKGSWLSRTLNFIGSEVHGLSLDIPTQPSLFDVAQVSTVLASDNRADISEIESVEAIVQEIDPDIIFHLAAQSLVLEGYRHPLGTFQTNVMGTANVIEASFSAQSTRTLVVVTTDKVYRNFEREEPYIESDQLGGSDPYSASKAAAEMVVEAYRGIQREGKPLIFTARAGNVVGGGDWSPWRLVPDLVESIQTGSSLQIRNPDATRPWQHVLDPLFGYLRLAEKANSENAQALAPSWNFGPGAKSVRSVSEFITQVENVVGKHIPINQISTSVKEHKFLSLDSSQAEDVLGWRPRWDFHETIQRTFEWYDRYATGIDMAEFTDMQISEYLRS